MSNIKYQRMKVNILSILAPQLAGKLATKLFSKSRNTANEYSKALIPMGAYCEKIASPEHRVENIYIWGDSGDIVLLVHGWGANCSSMFGFVQSLLDQGFRVATFDAPAHGCTPGEYTTMREFTKAAEHIIKQLGDVRHIVAHSLGSIVGMAVSAKNPNIESITIVSAPVSLSDVLDIWSSNSIEISDFIRQRVLSQLLKDNGVPVSYWDIGLLARDWVKPVLVIHDDDDDVVGFHADKIKNFFPTGEIRLTEGLGHAKILMSKQVHNFVSDFITTPVQQRDAAI
jgi:omega-6 fatty acid desaturase (delta-12 desaturase)